MMKRLLPFLLCLATASLLANDPVLAQRGSRPAARPSARPSARPASRPAPRPSARPAPRPASRPSARPASRPSSRPSSRPTARPSSRPSSRPSATPSRSTSGRSTAGRSTSGASRGSAGRSTPSTTPSSRTPARVTPRTSASSSRVTPSSSRGTSSGSSSASGSRPSSTRSAAPAREPLNIPGVLDLQHTGNQNRRIRFPAPYKGGATQARPTGRPAIGSGRGTSSGTRPSAARSTGAGAGRGLSAPGRITQSPRNGQATVNQAKSFQQRRAVASRTVSRDDVLQRYRGSSATRDAKSPRTDVRGPSTARGARDGGAAKGTSRLDGAGTSRVAGRSGKKDTQGAASRGARAGGAAQVQDLTPRKGRADRNDYARGVALRAKAVGAGSVAAGGGSAIVPAVGHHPDAWAAGNSYVGWCQSSNYWVWSSCGWISWNWCLAPFSFCNSYWWNGYWSCGGYWNYGYRPSWYWYGPFIPWRYSAVYPVYVDDGPDVIYIESDPEVIYIDSGEAVEEEQAGWVPQMPPPPANAAPSKNLNRVGHHYLGLGDEAFGQGRYSDAAHYYAKAVEFAPDEGVLYLVLSDALFATGDYRYAAYALRKALELDPSVLAQIVDKRSFYSDSTDFDRQLALLELYLKDHFLDEDARLVLAANYLFGGRPAAAVDLLEDPFSGEVVRSPAGKALLDAARAIQYGQPVNPGPPAAPRPLEGVPFLPGEEI